MMPLIAQAYTVGQYAIIFVVIAAIVGICLVAARAAGISVPPWIITIAWIVAAAFVAILAIKFLLGML